MTQNREDEEEKVFVDGAGDIPVWDIHMETELDNFKPKVCPLPTHHIFQHLITNFIFRFFNTLSLGSDLNYTSYLILTLLHTIQTRFVLTFALENPKP